MHRTGRTSSGHQGHNSLIYPNLSQDHSSISVNPPPYNPYYEDNKYNKAQEYNYSNVEQEQPGFSEKQESPSSRPLYIFPETATFPLFGEIIAEFVGTLFLVLIACGCANATWNASQGVGTTVVSIAFGATIATLVVALAPVSGCHINPVVSVVFALHGRTSVIRMVFYFGAQCAGGIAGAEILNVITSPELHATLALTVPTATIDQGQAVAVEAFITFFLVGVIMLVTEENRDITLAPLAIGMAVTATHMFAVQYTGASMNPARSLGPAVVLGMYDDHWIYWVGPFAGGLSFSVFYKLYRNQRFSYNSTT